MHMLLRDTALSPWGCSSKQGNRFYNKTGENSGLFILNDRPYENPAQNKSSFANKEQRKEVSPSCCRKGMKSSATVPARAWLEGPETTW